MERLISTNQKRYLVNDSPSLNYSNVGFGMGSGTNVARASADIVILNDSFSSIVKAIMWGRSVYKNIQSFLVFQLTINVAFCLTALFAPLIGIETPYTVTQVLFINLVLDSLAALCLASEPADENVMKDKPRKPKDFIITKPMYKTILGFGCFIFLLQSFIVYDIAHNNSAWFGLGLTELFAIFMTISWWNLFDIRVFGKHRSVFHNLGKNKYFVIGSAAVLIGLILIIQFGGSVFNVHPLSLKEWIIILLATSPVVIVREIWFRIRSKIKK